jgi:hypothetical protein
MQADPAANLFLKGLAVVDDVAYFGASVWAERAIRCARAPSPCALQLRAGPFSRAEQHPACSLQRPPQQAALAPPLRPRPAGTALTTKACSLRSTSSPKTSCGHARWVLLALQHARWVLLALQHGCVVC